jgi:hypothetical protein
MRSNVLLAVGGWQLIAHDFFLPEATLQMKNELFTYFCGREIESD